MDSENKLIFFESDAIRAMMLRVCVVTHHRISAMFHGGKNSYFEHLVIKMVLTISPTIPLLDIERTACDV
jgi:hypothetical protein